MKNEYFESKMKLLKKGIIFSYNYLEFFKLDYLNEIINKIFFYSSLRSPFFS